MKLQEISRLLESQLPGATLMLQTLPDSDYISLYLLVPMFDDSQLCHSVHESVADSPPYWIFCWASGRALAQRIGEGCIDVRDKKILDFGAGSGVVVIAAKKAGAREVIACEIDPVAKHLIKLNSEANQVDIEIWESIKSRDYEFDLVLAADVLYEKQNLKWLDAFRRYGKDVIIADSRIKNLQHPHYRNMDQVITTSFPDFAEAKAFNEVNIYRTIQSGEPPV